MERYNIEIYDELNKILNLSTKQFSEIFCKRSESYSRVLKKQNKPIPTEVLINIFDELNKKRDLESFTIREQIDGLLKIIANEIASRSMREEHLKLRNMLSEIVTEINGTREPNRPEIIIC